MFRRNSTDAAADAGAEAAKLPMSELIKLIDGNVAQLRDSDLNRYRYREIVRDRYDSDRATLIEAHGGFVPRYGSDEPTAA